MSKTKKTPKISQSLMKSLNAYVNGEECGLKFKAKFIDGKSGEPTDAMNLGNWFEYIATGQLPRDGEIPSPKRKKNGDLSIDYVRMEAQASNFNTLMATHGFDIISTGHVFNKSEDSTGIADIIARKDGRTCIVDLKSSGLIDDRWSEFGWNLDAIGQKDKLLVQAIHYTMLAQEEFGEEVDFYFAVFSSKNDYDFMLLKVDIYPETMEQHYKYIQSSKKILKREIDNGFRASHKYRECAKCFLRESCSEALKTAEINEICY
tara:strand:+ start:2236 stop:3021 length:786 start_codon:yes stop_codon:yes gene_type:complete